MNSKERRVDARVKIRVPFCFRDLNDPKSVNEEAESENVSRRGIYFETECDLQVGALLAVSMQMPQDTIRKSSSDVSCVARVVHVRKKAFAGAKKGIGLHIDRYDARTWLAERWAS